MEAVNSVSDSPCQNIILKEIHTMSFGVNYIENRLYIEDIPAETIAESVGTPCFVYSKNEIESRFKSYTNAFKDLADIICYSVKANSNLAVLKLFASMGAGFDIVSSGELRRVIRAGGYPSKTVFSGVGKTEAEIEEAINSKILFFNVESEAELRLINSVAGRLGTKAPVALRVNPDVDPSTHPYISTGFRKSKFGIEIGKAKEVYKTASEMVNIDVKAIDAHIGSQIFDLSSFADSLKKLSELASELRSSGIDIEYIDIGGGLAISYDKNDNPPTPEEYAEVIRGIVKSDDYKLILEPGRSLVGNAGIMITRVIYTKEGSDKKFIIVDAAMNDLIRPAFYNSHHEIVPLKSENSEEEIFDIVGPVCESGDFFAQDRKFKKVSSGEYIAVLSAGAYGFVMSSNYNSRPRAAEVLVSGDKFAVIKERESFEDLIRSESIPEFL